MPVPDCARAALVAAPSAVMTSNSTNASEKRLVFHVMDRSSYSRRAFANGGKRIPGGTCQEHTGEWLLCIVTRAPRFKQGSEARKCKNERSWIKGTRRLISWTVGHGRNRITRVRPIGQRG